METIIDLLKEKVKAENPKVNFVSSYKQNLTYEGQLSNGLKFRMEVYEYRYTFSPTEMAVDLIDCDRCEVNEIK